MYSLTSETIVKMNQDLQKASVREVLTHASNQFDQDVAISFSGAEDVVLIDMAHQAGLSVRVFSLDTGRLHAETYEFMERVRDHYSIPIEFCCPEKESLEKLVSQKGMYSFFKDGHQECCGIRKVQPLRKKLHTLKAWITGQRQDQSPGTRTEIPIMQLDSGFGSPESILIKYNPLANWTSSRVWNYIRNNRVPYNRLHERGFISLGCEPCTRPVLPNQHEREGRWWWEEATQKECGLHVINLDAMKKD